MDHIDYLEILEPPKRSSDVLDKKYSRIWEILEVLAILEHLKGMFHVLEP